MITPVAQFNFAGSKRVDSRLTFTRSSIGSYFDHKGLIRTDPVDTARIDYDPLTGECLGVLIENDFIQLDPNSEIFTNAAGVAVSSNSAVAPDGEVTAETIIESAVTSEHYVNDITLVPDIGQYTLIFFVKDGSSANRYAIARIAGGNLASVAFNPRTNSFSTPLGVNYISHGSKALQNGWFLVWLAASTTSATSTVFRIQMSNTTTVAPYLGDGSSSIIAWGRVVKKGAYIPRYVKSLGGTVTKAVDNLKIAEPKFSELMTYNNFGIIITALPWVDAIYRYFWVMSDGTTNNYIALRQIAGVIYLTGVVGGVTSFNIQCLSTTCVTDESITIAVSYTPSLTGLAANGKPVDSAVPSLVMPVLTQLELGSFDITAAGYLNSTIAKVTPYASSIFNYLQELSK